jgi:hypothetical protein
MDLIGFLLWGVPIICSIGAALFDLSQTLVRRLRR